MLLIKGVRDYTSQHRTLFDGDTHSTSQMDWGHPSSNRVYREEDNATSHGSQPPPIIYRQDQPVSIELESINQRSLGYSNSGKGVHHPLNHNPSPTVLATPSPPINHRNISSRGGDPNAVRETSSTEGTSQYEGILFQHVYGPQGRWRSETSHQSETPKQVCGIRAFQNGGPAHSQGLYSEE